MHKQLQKEGADSIPISTFSLWHLVRDALLTDKVKVRPEVIAAKEILEEIQEEETRRSVGLAESHRDQKEMSEVPGGTLESDTGLRLAPKSACFRAQNQIAITSENGEGSLSSSAENSLSDEEAQLTQEIKVLQKRLEHCMVKDSSCVLSAQSAYNEDWRRRESCWGLTDDREAEEGSGRRGGV